MTREWDWDLERRGRVFTNLFEVPAKCSKSGHIFWCTTRNTLLAEGAKFMLNQFVVKINAMYFWGILEY